MPTSKVCGMCAKCKKEFKQGDTGVFFGHVRIVRDNLEPGGVTCVHVPTVACRVSHLSTEERCIVCDKCWAEIKLGYLISDMDIKGCTPICGPEYEGPQ